MSGKKRCRLIAVAVAAGVSSIAPTAFAVDNVWTGAGANNNWNTGANWGNPEAAAGGNHVPEANNGHPGDEDAVVNLATPFPLINADTPNPRDTKVGFANGTTGRVDQSAGVHEMGGWFFVGGGGGTGTYNMNGGTLRAGRLLLGGVDFNAGGNGTFNQTAGAVEFTDAGQESRIGDATGTGNYNMSGGTLTSAGNFQVGAGSAGGGTGTFTQTGGTVTFNNDFPSIGRFTGSIGTHTISAGAINKPSANGAYIVGENGTANLNVSGTGTVTVASNMTLGLGPAGNGTVTQTGGTVSVGGDLLLTTNAAATARYNLRGGTLDMTGGAITPGAGSITVEFSGGRLLNAATINGPFAQTGGRLSPGASPGTTTINGAYSLTGTGAYEAELAPGGASDLVDVNGIANLGGGSLDVVPLGSLSLGQSFTILTYDSLVGTFSGRANGSTFTEDGHQFLINYANGGNNVTLTVVPEPATAGLAAMAAAGLLLRRRRVPRG